MKHLILVKHSQPVLDAHLPPSSWRLSSVGKASCLELAQHLHIYQPFALSTSPELKAVETTEIIAAKFSQGYTIYPGLDEHRRPDPPLSLSDQKGFHNSIKRLFSYPNQLVFGAETAAHALERFSYAIEDLIQHCPLDNLVVVTHGTVITLWTSHITGQDPYPLWRSLKLPAYLIFEYPGPQLRLIKNIQ